MCLLLGSVENMEDFVTLDELAEDEDEAEQAAESIGRWRRSAADEPMNEWLMTRVRPAHRQHQEGGEYGGHAGPARPRLRHVWVA